MLNYHVVLVTYILKNFLRFLYGTFARKNAFVLFVWEYHYILSLFKVTLMDIRFLVDYVYVLFLFFSVVKVLPQYLLSSIIVYLCELPL